MTNRQAERERVARVVDGDYHLRARAFIETHKLPDDLHSALKQAFNEVARLAIASTEARVLEEAAHVAETEGVYSGLNTFCGGPDWYKHGKAIAATLRKLAQERRP